MRQEREFLLKLIKQNSLIVNSYLFIKYFIKRYIIKRAFHNIYLHPDSELVKVPKTTKKQSFFGYYNISPFNSKGDILFGQVQTNETRGSLVERLSIGLKTTNNIINEIGSSNAWNWQQGCMLQWFARSESSIIYNDYSIKDNSYIAKLRNIASSEERILHKPIYSVAKSGKFALTLNFDRLALMRADYGYFNRNIVWGDLPSDSKDGIWRIDIEKNDSKLIMALEKLKNFQPVPTMEGARHKVNHIDIAPDGKRFMFLHRWVGPKGRFMRLLTANCNNGSDLYYVTGDEMVSHNCWWGNNDIISFCRLTDRRNRYVHFKDKTGFIAVIGENDFSRDGHPSVSPDGKWMLTDDYPDKSRFSRLYLYKIKNKKKILLGRFFQPLIYAGERRIDLHPKWSPDGKQIAFESGHKGKRTLYVLSIENVLENE